MLNDKRRTKAFLETIDAVVRPGDVVVDIGTGTGVLSIACVRAGARRVYAIESGDVAEYARHMFDTNGVSDRVVLFRGWSDEIVLPERCDVLVTETLGHDPLAEGILPSTRDALHRFLKPDARMIPSSVELFCLPVSIPPEAKRDCILQESELEAWRTWYGIDFSPLRGARDRDSFAHFLDPFMAKGWLVLGPPTFVGHWDLRMRRRVGRACRGVAQMTGAGTLDGLLFYFELSTTEGTFLSTAPASVDSRNHWLTPVRVFVDSIPVRRHDEFLVQYWPDPRTTAPSCRCERLPRRPDEDWQGEPP